MRSARASAEIALGASPATVWAYVTDPDNFAAYVEGYGGGRVTTANCTGLGARYEWAGRAGPLRLAASEEVVP
ncbi:MAG: SRPBCC family protein [Actinomycetia bacterium]|nr:SRPBCC family protein [Actinomycetes bacterium]